MNYRVYDTRLSPAPKGFSNTGAICWFNSLLQSLVSCTSLSQRMIEYAQAGASDSDQAVANNDFHRAYMAMLRDYINGYDVYGRSAEMLAMLMRHLHANGMHMLGNTQECAHEGFTQTLDALGPAAEVFHMEHLGNISCVCGHESNQRDKSYALLINDLFSCSEQMSGHIHQFNNQVTEYTCEHCRQCADTRRTYTLKQLRECIVLFYNQFYAKSCKWFPHEMTFPAMPRGTNLTYQLVAQIEHIGNMNGGHYYAYVRRGDTWYCTNDTSVSNVNPGPTANTFMVFYNLVSHE